jgi:rhodanese-related sulfurtransferase
LAYAPLPGAGLRSDNGFTFTNKEQMMSIVTAVPAAPNEAALAHFEGEFAFETDCWDVHSVMGTPEQDFVLLDVRGTEKFRAGHVPGAVDLTHGKIIASKLADYPADTLFVTYCAGPHCNGAARGAIRLAKLGRRVKIMTGGITGWLDEGFSLATGD